MDTYRATGLAEGWIYTEDENEIIEAWQHLHDTGVAYELQGWFGRTAAGLVKEGIIKK
jgi:Leu/Phe-tRNA-protein transferase